MLTLLLGMSLLPDNSLVNSYAQSIITCDKLS